MDPKLKLAQYEAGLFSCQLWVHALTGQGVQKNTASRWSGTSHVQLNSTTDAERKRRCDVMFKVLGRCFPAR